MSGWLPILAVLACGCSPEDDPEKQRPIRFMLTPAPGDGDVSLDRIEEVAEGWAVRWERATGLDVSVESGGIPVRFVDGLMHEGIERCAYTEFRFELGERDGWYRVERILLNTKPPAGCPIWDFALGHELCHVLGGPAAEHSSSGICRERVDGLHGMSIDSGALEAVCTHAPCRVLAPEIHPNP